MSRQKYVVYENENYTGQDQYFVFKKSNFEWVNYCDTYNCNGVKADGYECGCDIEEFPENEGAHWEVLAYTFWNGKNWVTIFAPQDGFFEFSEIDGELEKQIIAELPGFPYIEGAIKTIQTENFEYTYTRYPVPHICSVR